MRTPTKGSSLLLLFPLVVFANCKVGATKKMGTPGDSTDAGIGGGTFDEECSNCHGSALTPAPPEDLDGNTARSEVGVGAHREHLTLANWHSEILCSNCHVVPATTNAPGHIDDDDDTAEVTFDDLNPNAQVALDTGACSNLYCHGNGQEDNGSVSWTDDLTLDCDSCHDSPKVGGDASAMSGFHGRHISDESIECTECHNSVVDEKREITGRELHVNGDKNLKFLQSGEWDSATKTCSNLACHRDETWE